MKRIGIDARLYFQTGVGVYTRNFLHFLEEIEEKNLQFYVYILEKDSDNIHFSNKNFVKREIPYYWHSFSEQVGFLNVLNQDKLDLMHFTYFSHPVFYKQKFIATIHDTTPLVFKTGRASAKNRLIYELKYRVFKYVLASQIKNADAIITPSIAVKNELIDFYGKQFENKINPIYEGINYELIDGAENTMLKKRFDSPFFLYVGNFYPHKNVEKLIEAFSKLKTATKLILVGPQDFFAKRLGQLVDKLSLKNRIVFYHNSEVSDLIFFYKNAEALIHPSLSEGFGLPLVEAAYFNLPIIASDIPVFHELLDGNYQKLDPKNVKDITNKINEFLKTKKVVDYKKLLKKYSFKKMTRDTLRVYLENL